MTSYKEMTSLGSYNEVISTKRAKAEAASTERFRQAREWCIRNLPDEHPDLAASTVLSLRVSGSWPSPTLVKARLKAQGRDHESLEGSNR